MTESLDRRLQRAQSEVAMARGCLCLKDANGYKAAEECLQSVKRIIDVAILDVDGLRLDLLQPTYEEEVRHDAESVEPQGNPHDEFDAESFDRRHDAFVADWNKTNPGWADRIHDAVYEGD